MNTDFRWPGGVGLALSVVLNIEEEAEAWRADGDPRMGRAAALDSFLARALTRPGVWAATRLRIA